MRLGFTSFAHIDHEREVLDGIQSGAGWIEDYRELRHVLDNCC